MKMHGKGHFRRNKWKYLAGAAGAMAAPFAFQRFRGAANMFRKGLFGKHGKVGFKDRWGRATSGMKQSWGANKGKGWFMRG